MMLSKLMLRSPGLGLVALCFLSLGGCSSNRPVMGDLDGKVTLDGQPFSAGRVELRDAKTGISAAAELQPDGTFKVITPPDGGIRVGTYAVVVLPPPPAPVDPIESAKGVQPKVEPSKIPQGYREFATSGFSIKVEKGPNHADFAMKSL